MIGAVQEKSKSGPCHSHEAC